MAEFVERYLRDERLQSAYLGQGVIGTNASPFDPGTASIRFHHASGRLGGMPGMWGYVQGGMGMVSFYFCDAAREAGAVVASGVPVARIVPGEGVELEGGERIRAAVVVSNADPRGTLRMLGHGCGCGWKAAVERVPIEGCTVKLNVLLRELPNFLCAAGVDAPHHYGQINAPLTHAEWKAGYAAARRESCRSICGASFIFRACMTRRVAPEGQHTMAVFAQYVPYKFADGTWDERREEVQRAGDRVDWAVLLATCETAVIDAQVLGPPDIEEKVGLTGGHIFQGECLPAYMWSNRLRRADADARGLSVRGVTHPGGSVIGSTGGMRRWPCCGTPHPQPINLRLLQRDGAWREAAAEAGAAVSGPDAVLYRGRAEPGGLRRRRERGRARS